MKKVGAKTTQAVKNTKIGASNIQKLIKEEAQVLKRKREIFEQIKSFNKELGELNKKGLGRLGLNERVMTIGAQGFGTTPVPGQGQAHPTGFVYPQNISRVAELEAELAPEEAVVLDSPENKEMCDTPVDKEMIGDDVKKQLIDMKEKLEMILSSMVGGTTAPTISSDTEASQAIAQTEMPEETEETEEETEEESDEEEEKEEDGEKEEETEEEDEVEDGEEEEIVIRENKGVKKFTATLKHDKGSKKITTTASNKEAAIAKFMKAEGCPKGAISNIIEK